MKFFKRNKQENAQEIVKKVAKTYKNKKEKGEKNPIETTAGNLVKIIKEKNDLTEIKKVLKASVDEKELPNDVVTETMAKISKIESIPDAVITDVVKAKKDDLPDSSIKTIIEKGDVDENERIQLIGTVVDKKINKKLVKNELRNLYSKTDEITDVEVVTSLEKIKNLEMGQEDDEIKELGEKVVAKKIAENYYSEIKRGTMLYSFSQFIPIKEMLEIDLPELVEKEYNKLEEENGKKKNRFSKRDLKDKILDDLAKEVALNFDNTGIVSIPRSESITNLSQKEKQRVLEQIKVYSKHGVTVQDAKSIKAQLIGEDYEEGKLSTLIMLEDSKLMDQLCFLPEDKRKKVIEILGDTLEKKLDEMDEEQEKDESMQENIENTKNDKEHKDDNNNNGKNNEEQEIKKADR